MPSLNQKYFGPADEIMIQTQEGISLPEGDLLFGVPKMIVYPKADEFALLLLGSGYTESDAHFLIRLIEGLGTVSGFPEIPAVKMDRFVSLLKQLLTTIHGLKNGFQTEDVRNFVDLFMDMKDCMK